MENNPYQEPEERAAKKVPVGPTRSIAKWIATICVVLLGYLLFSSVVNYPSSTHSVPVAQPATTQKVELPRTGTVIISKPDAARSNAETSEPKRIDVVVGRTTEKSVAPDLTVPTLSLPALANRAEDTRPKDRTLPRESSQDRVRETARVASPPPLPKARLDSAVRESVTPILPYEEALDPNTARSATERADIERRIAERQRAIAATFSAAPVAQKPTTSLPAAPAPLARGGIRETITPIPPYVERIDPSILADREQQRTASASNNRATTGRAATQESSGSQNPALLDATVAPACRGLTGLVLRQCQRCEPLSFLARGLCKEQVRKEYCAGRYGRDDACVLDGYSRGF